MRHDRAAVTAAISALAAVLTGTAIAQNGVEKVYWDSVDENGRLFGGVFWIESPAREPIEAMPFDSTTVHGRAGTANRYKFVTVGDGYTSAELGAYATHAQNAIDKLLLQQPFKNYASYIVVTRVDVISAQSGVDNDPTQGISKNTALDMGFWCGGTERALCVSVNKARSAANNAPGGFNQVLAIANSTKYGGVGYPSSDTGTLSGGNASAAEIAIHELGHAMGDLADEYDYDGPETYTGPELSTVNASIYTAAQQTAQMRKWWRWIGVNEPAWDGIVGSYEGCNYSKFGIYRPTNNSKMRALGRPFNHPSGEALIKELYRVVKPIDASTPTSTVLTGRESVFVTTMKPVANTISVQWSLDGSPIAGATGETLDLCAVHVANGAHTLGVTVVDNTPWVLDPATRTNYLTQELNWTMNVSRCAADYNCDSFLTGEDFDAYVAEFAAGGAGADFNADGFVNGDDFDAFVAAFVAGC